ncbi:hypothetical protein FHT86_001357 [Rhizobium sp. BK313]|nr:hypothetical protein [Rhizobium sp. BK313]
MLRHPALRSRLWAFVAAATQWLDRFGYAEPLLTPQYRP